MSHPPSISSRPITPAPIRSALLRDRPISLTVRWQHSSFSTGSDQTCVDVAVRDGRVLVRDSKNPDDGPLAFTFAEWQVFLLGVRAGEFELPPRNPSTREDAR